jgi:hypothetical protein
MKKIIGIFICMLLISIPVLSVSSAEDKGAALEIEVFGGLHTGVTIRNVGDTDALFVYWNITAEGGFIKKINVTSSGVVASLPPNNDDMVELKITLPSDQIRGFGKITIKVRAGSLLTSEIEKEVDGFLLFFFLILLP